jgi:threonine dehydratase
MIRRSMKKHLQPEDYLKKILTARVYDVAVESPSEPARNLSRRLHNKVLLKREDQQPVFSFKLRGAYNKMAHLHAGAVAARRASAPRPATMPRASPGGPRLGARAVIVMP